LCLGAVVLAYGGVFSPEAAAVAVGVAEKVGNTAPPWAGGRRVTRPPGLIRSVVSHFRISPERAAKYR